MTADYQATGEDEGPVFRSPGGDGGAVPGPPTIRLAPSSGWVPLRLPALWEYRELLYFLIWRDMKVRYKQTVLGAFWAVLQPLATMLIFSVFLGHLARVPSDGVPYPLLVFAALVPWTLFASGLSQSANSVISNQALITKVYFPRLHIPIAAAFTGSIDFLLSLGVLLIMMFFYGVYPTARIVWLPGFAVLAFTACLGTGLWFSALNVRYRDVRYVITFLVQAWMFATPVAYPGSLVPERWRILYSINPMVGVVEGFRWALLGTDSSPGVMVLVSSLAALVVLVGGLFYFRRMERSFADVV